MKKTKTVLRPEQLADVLGGQGLMLDPGSARVWLTLDPSEEHTPPPAGTVKIGLTVDPNG